jgi:hypothetical protein
MALGYAIRFHEDPTAAAPGVSYWNGRGQTATADAVGLNESETFLDSEVDETDLMTLLGNIQVGQPDKHARLVRVDVTVNLV